MYVRAIARQYLKLQVFVSQTSAAKQAKSSMLAAVRMVLIKAVRAMKANWK